jgi:hypothetical protein
MNRRALLTALPALGAAAVPQFSFAQAQRAICYNCPPEWADWGGMLKLVGQRTGIIVPPDNKNSGQSLAALIAELSLPDRRPRVCPPANRQAGAARRSSRESIGTCVRAHERARERVPCASADMVHAAIG